MTGLDLSTPAGLGGKLWGQDPAVGGPSSPFVPAGDPGWEADAGSVFALLSSPLRHWGNHLSLGPYSLCPP